MDKEAVNAEELLSDLRLYYKALEATYNENNSFGKMIKNAIQVIEDMRSREKFYTFVWETLGFQTMGQLEDMYHKRGDCSDLI